MTISEKLRSIVSIFNSFSPVSKITRDDIENCKELSKATGLTWTPIQHIDPFMTRGTMMHVSYEARLYDRKHEFFASCVSDAISTADKSARPEGTLPVRIMGTSDIFGTPLIYVDRTDMGGGDLLAQRLSTVDSDNLKADIDAALKFAEEYLIQRFPEKYGPSLD